MTLFSLRMSQPRHPRCLHFAVGARAAVAAGFKSPCHHCRSNVYLLSPCRTAGCKPHSRTAARGRFATARPHLAKPNGDEQHCRGQLAHPSTAPQEARNGKGYPKIDPNHLHAATKGGGAATEDRRRKTETYDYDIVILSWASLIGPYHSPVMRSSLPQPPSLPVPSVIELVLLHLSIYPHTSSSLWRRTVSSTSTLPSPTMVLRTLPTPFRRSTHPFQFQTCQSFVPILIIRHRDDRR